MGTFSAIGYFTEHPHWFLREDEALSITDPLLCWIDTLPVKAVKKVEQNIWPVFLLIGLVMAVLPRILAEIKLNGRKRDTVRAQGETGGYGGPFGSQDGAFGIAGYPASAGNGASPASDAGADGGDPSRPPNIPGINW